MGCILSITYGNKNGSKNTDYFIGKPLVSRPVKQRIIDEYKRVISKANEDSLTLHQIEMIFQNLKLVISKSHLNEASSKLGHVSGHLFNLQDLLDLFDYCSKPSHTIESLFNEADRSESKGLSGEDLHFFYLTHFPKSMVPSVSTCSELVIKYELLALESLEKHHALSSSTLSSSPNPKQTRRASLTSNNRRVTRSPRLSFQGFLLLLTDATFNGIADPTKLYSVYQDMSKPLSHYYINSSHNTYLSGGQIKGHASAAAIARSLRLGVRVIELDCYNGADGSPIVTHGKTLVKPCTFESCIIAIRENAFLASEYPVILTIENHCDSTQQKRMSTILHDNLGSWLYYDPEIMKTVAALQKNPTDSKLLDKIFSGPKEWVSPNDLKRRVVIRDKARRAKDPTDKKQHQKNLTNQVIENEVVGKSSPSESFDLGSEETQDLSVVTVNLDVNDFSDTHEQDKATILQRRQSRKDSEDLEDHGIFGFLDVLSEKPQITVKQSSFMANDAVNSLTAMSATDITWLELLYIKNVKMIVEITKEEESGNNNGNSHANLISASQKEESVIIANTSNGNVKNPATGNHPNTRNQKKTEVVMIREVPYCSSSSIPEKRMMKLCRPGERGSEMARYTQRHLVRSYPDGTRISSTNYNPITPWNFGIQIAALNYQTNGLPVWLSQGKFSDNGGCGYVLKPEGMFTIRRGIDLSGENLSYPWDLKPRSVEKITGLKITLISGHFLPKPGHAHTTDLGRRDPVDPFVEIHMFGAPQDTSDHERHEVSAKAIAAQNLRKVSRKEMSPSIASTNETALTVSSGASVNTTSTSNALPAPVGLGAPPEKRKSITGDGLIKKRKSIQDFQAPVLKHKRSMVVKGNGINPSWNESFEFNIEYPELAIMSVIVKDADLIGGEDVVGHAAIPVQIIRPGYRVIPLRNSESAPIENAFLFVHVEIDSPFAATS